VLTREVKRKHGEITWQQRQGYEADLPSWDMGRK